MTSGKLISGNAQKNNSSVIVGAGNVNTSLAVDNSIINNNLGYPDKQPSRTYLSGVSSLFRGSSVSITAITQSGSTGYINIQKTSHGLAVGNVIEVTGADVSSYNRTQRVTVVTDANNFRTDCAYSSNTSTHGAYKTLTRDFNKVNPDNIIGYLLSEYIAGTADTTNRIVSTVTDRHSIHAKHGDRRINITNWNYLTGVPTKGANAGDAFYFKDSANSNQTTSPLPTRAIPGEFVYQYGGATPTQDDYDALI